MDKFKRLTNYVRNNFDELAILTLLLSISKKKVFSSLSTDESLVLSALRRSSNEFKTIPLDEIGSIIDNYSASQKNGLINNIKGILFELEFIKVENEDGDNIIAYQFENTNYPTYDIALIDEDTGDIVNEIQLKATENISYINDWIEKNGSENIILTDEIARKLGLQSSGITNEGLKIRVEDFLEKIVELDDVSLESAISGIGIISIAISVIGLAKKWKTGEISRDKFLKMSSIMTGQKIIKLSLLAITLSIPGLNVLTSIGLTTTVILKGKRALEKF